AGDGAFELKGLDAAHRHTLCAWSEGWAPLFFDLPAEERSKNEWDVGVLTFVRAGALTGTALDSGGSPLPGVEMRLSGISEPQREPPLERDGKPLRWPLEYEHLRDYRSFHADEHGRFVVSDLAPGRYRLMIGAKRFTTEVEVVGARENALGPINVTADIVHPR